MTPITPAQLKKIHVLLGQTGQMPYKAEIVNGFSNGRTQSSRELTIMEAKLMIEFLLQTSGCSRIQGAIWHIAYKMGIITGDSPAEKSMNNAKLDMFCKQYGTVKKTLREQSTAELKKTHRQFEAMLKKHDSKQVDVAYLEQLNKALPALIEKEDYENASSVKQEIDRVNAKLTPKRKRVPKTV